MVRALSRALGKGREKEVCLLVPISYQAPGEAGKAMKQIIPGHLG